MILACYIFFFGVKVNYNSDGSMHLSLKKKITLYIDVLAKSHLDNAKHINIPMVSGLKFYKEGNDDLMADPSL